MSTAFVMSGGGVKGAFQVGVLSQLMLRPNCIYGTSIGALNGAAYAYTTIDTIRKHWLSLESRSDILTFNKSMLLLSADGVYNMNPLREDFIDKVIVGNPVCEVNVCRVNLNTGEKQYVSNMNTSNKDFRDAVQDSCTIPVAMSPRDVYVDGGVREVVPLRKAIEDGHKDITVILCGPWTDNPWPKWDILAKSKFLRILQIALRSTDDIMNHEVKYDDLYSTLGLLTEDINVRVYMPHAYLYDTLEVDPKKIKDAMKQGERAIPVNLRDLFK